MTEPRFSIEALALSEERASFSCGVEVLDRYFHSYVTQDIKRRVTACFVAKDLAEGRTAGFYTLAASSVPLPDLPDHLARKLPRYPLVPVARIGRLAVDLHYRGQQLGAALLWDAIMRASRSELMVYGLVVDAKDEQAEAFYRHFGFASLPTLRRCLVLPLARFIPTV
jgi:GNAT superfamily N-acetyltransferase